MVGQASTVNTTKRLHLFFGLVYIALLVIAAVFLLPDYWYLWLILVLIVVMRAITWTSRKQNYECKKCKTAFSGEKRRFSLVPKPADLYGTEKSLRCPNCGSRDIRLVEAKKR